MIDDIMQALLESESRMAVLDEQIENICELRSKEYSVQKELKKQIFLEKFPLKFFSWKLHIYALKLESSNLEESQIEDAYSIGDGIILEDNVTLDHVRGNYLELYFKNINDIIPFTTKHEIKFSVYSKDQDMVDFFKNLSL